MASARIDGPAGATTTVIAAPGVGKKIRIHAIFAATNHTTGSFRLHSTTVDVIGDAGIPVNNTTIAREVIMPYSPSPWAELADNEALSVTTVASTCVGRVIFQTVDA